MRTSEQLCLKPSLKAQERALSLICSPNSLRTDVSICLDMKRVSYQTNYRTAESGIAEEAWREIEEFSQVGKRPEREHYSRPTLDVTELLHLMEALFYYV